MGGEEIDKRTVDFFVICLEVIFNWNAICSDHKWLNAAGHEPFFGCMVDSLGA